MSKFNAHEFDGKQCGTCGLRHDPPPNTTAFYGASFLRHREDSPWIVHEGKPQCPGCQQQRLNPPVFPSCKIDPLPVVRSSDICRVWVSEPGVTGHTCCNPLPCPIHTRLPNPARHVRRDGRDNLSQGLPDDEDTTR